MMHLFLRKIFPEQQIGLIRKEVLGRPKAI